MSSKAAKISEQDANQICLRSQPCAGVEDQDITSYTFLQRALLFAELSMIAYLPQKEALAAASRIGFNDSHFYNNDGSQAYSFANERDIVIAFRGTEPNEWNDIKADMDATKALAETVGHVHRGFKKEVDDLWPQLEEMLVANKINLAKKLWFTGHSFCLLYTSPSPRDKRQSRMPSSA